LSRGLIISGIRSKHRHRDLKGEEFFNVEKYPVMTFRSQKVVVASPVHLKVSGELTINAVTKQVMLDLQGPTDPIKDTRNRMKTGPSATTKMSRKEFGILYNSDLETG
jgi:polyisoprenoid-binding protein YceI